MQIYYYFFNDDKNVMLNCLFVHHFVSVPLQKNFNYGIYF